MRAETMRIQKHNQQPAATCVGVRRTHSSALALGDMSVQAVNAPRMLPGARPALAVQVHSWQGAAHAHGGRAARDAAAAGVRSGRARAGRRGRRSGRGRHRRRGWRGRPVGAAARQPTSGLSFANITKLGYAATGPARGTSPTAAGAAAPRAWGPGAAAARPPASAGRRRAGCMGRRRQGERALGAGQLPRRRGGFGAHLLADQLSAAMAAHKAVAAAGGAEDDGGSGAKKVREGGKPTLLLCTAQRRY